jgi:predicted ABC-type ATPase
MNAPSVVVLAGPNGAGKTTAAPALLQGKLAVDQFVNADVIAQGLSGFAPKTVAVAAGRIMLARLNELAAARVSFAFETTLASKTFAPRLKALIATGYRCHLIYLWLPDADQAVARVASRVLLGGHDVPEATVRRRYRAGIRNFLHLYRPLSRSWRMYDNSGGPTPRLIARGRGLGGEVILQPDVWQRFLQEADDGPNEGG